MEILSPAGSREAVNAAVFSGADAVYLGASGFNARINAANFSDDELRDAVTFCHERGVKVYATVNTLVSDRELADALKLAEFLTDAGVDAFIVQDLGVASLLKKCSPSVPLHASTQMSVCSLDGVNALAELGFSRVVLARELSFEDISYITHNTPLEIEVFVHGAFCMSYSGQCYMSSIIGGRSGNRGLCAQPCRLPYRNGYTLSLKDNCLLEHVKKLEAAGVTSLKLEGRMKGAEYVSAVTDMYVRAKNGEEYSADKKDYLAKIFSRQGFTDGYFTNKAGSAMFGVRKENEETVRVNVPTVEYKRFPLDIKYISDGKTAVVSAKTDDGYYAETSVPVTPAEKKPTVAEDIEISLSKFGGTPYYVEKIEVNAHQGDFIPVSLINSARRDLIKSLTEMRTVKNQSFVLRKKEPYIFTENTENTAVEAFFSDFSQVPENASLLSRIWLPSEAFIRKNIHETVSIYGEKLGVVIPSVFHDSEKKTVMKHLEAAKEYGVSDALCGNIGHIRLAADEGFTPHGDYGLNVYNRESVREYIDLGAKDITLSFELTLRQCADLCGKETGIIAYGRLPFMIMKNCVKGGDGKGCERKGKAAYLTDRMKKDFLITCGFGCRNRLWNADVLWLADKALPRFGFIRLLFTDENKNEAERVINTYLTGDGAPPENMTRGRYY